MILVIEKNREFLAVDHFPHWNDEKNKIASLSALETECTCGTQHMLVHDAMCQHCWTRLLERNGN